MTTTLESYLTKLSNTTSFSPIVNLKCDKYTDNSTSGHILKEYEGIPENLIVNLIVWFVLLVLFTFLRRVGDYGRFGLLQRDHEEERWTTLFYSQRSTESDASDSTSSQNLNIYRDDYFISWLFNIFRLKDKHILEKCGKDALNYLVFQRHLIVYLAIITVLSISIILPINYSGNVLYDKKVFGSTTIVNVAANSPVLWVHLVLSWVYLIICAIFMRMFSKKMKYVESNYVSRTVMLINIPKDKCEHEMIQKHFSECYPDLEICDIQFAYDIAELTEIDKERHSMHTGRLTSQKIYNQTNERPKMYPFHCGTLFETCCCCCEGIFYKTDAIDYYTDCEKHLRDRLAIAKEIAYNNPLGVAFVTFRDELMAASFLKHYEIEKISKCCCCCVKHSEETQLVSSVSNELDTKHWVVQYAPSPNNIKWENLAYIDATWRFRYIAINAFLWILMIFCTTPPIFIDILSRWGQDLHVNYIRNYLPSYLTEFLPSLLLRLFSALLPVLVGYTAYLEKHWTKSAENYSMMVKTFVVLLFMVLILPTVGLNSIDGLILYWLDKNQMDKNFKWKCISDNGAFFIKYITTCSLIGTALDLLRLPELFVYFIKSFWSRSMSERMAVRLQAAYEFEYGVQYAWVLTVFTVTICFSIVCPLITPFGLTYLLLKHFVDRYNIYFAYVYSKVDKKIHRSAVSFCISSVIILQFCILFFIVIRNGSNDVMIVFQSLVICISSLIFIGQMSFGWFKKLSLFSMKAKTDNVEGMEEENNNNNNNNDNNININNNNNIRGVNEAITVDITSTDNSPKREETQSVFVPGLLRPPTPTDDAQSSISDSVSHISETNTIDGEIDRRKFENRINDSTMSISSKYGTVTIDN